MKSELAAGRSVGEMASKDAPELPPVHPESDDDDDLVEAALQAERYIDCPPPETPVFEQEVEEFTTLIAYEHGPCELPLFNNAGCEIVELVADSESSSSHDPLSPDRCIDLLQVASPANCC